MPNIHSTTRSEGLQDQNYASSSSPGIDAMALTEVTYVTDAHELGMKHERVNSECMTGPCPFGEFGKLCMEVRLNIWQYLMPELRKESEPPTEIYGSRIISSPRSGNRLAIMRTSQALKYEIRAELYRSRSLCISIRPGRRGWRAEDLPGSTMTDFQNTKFHQFKSIRVEVSCPPSGDPGQLLYARSSILNFIRVLRGCREVIEYCEPYCTINDQQQLEPWINGKRKDGSKLCPRIPKLQVAFLDTEVDTWQDGSGVRISFREEPYIEDNLELLISPFGYLRNAEQINFELPEGLILGARLLKMVQYIEAASLAHCFDDNGSDDGYYNDIDGVVQTEARRLLALDCALDRTSGPTAAILRRERLIHLRWYRKSFEHIIDRHMPLTPWRKFGPRLRRRCDDFEFLDPSYQDHAWKLYVTHDPNWLDTWRSFWPDGIPPTDSPAWIALADEADGWKSDRPSYVPFT